MKTIARFSPRPSSTWAARLRARLAAFGRDKQATSAVEFAIVASPFFMLMMGIMQIGIFYMTQSSLDAALMKTADAMRNSFTTGTVWAQPSASALKTMVVSNAGGLISNNATLSVEVRQFANLDSAVVPIVDGVTDYGTSSSVLVLRAQATAVTFAPGLGALSTVRSAVILRRQGT